MNQVGSFVCGLAIGAAGGVTGCYLVLKKRFDKMYAELQNQMYEEVDRRMEEFYERYNEYAQKASNDIEDDREILEGIDEEVTDDGPKKYQDAYRPTGRVPYKNEEDFPETEEEDEAPAADPYESTPERDREAFERRERDKKKQPRLITDSAFAELDQSIDKGVLLYYTENGVICDENNIPLEDPERFVGNCLDKYSFGSSDEMLVFVMNYELNTAYEVQKIRDFYEED